MAEDLKEEEDETSTNTDQLEEKTLETEEGGEENETLEEPSEDNVMISKSELEKLQKDAGEKENYRKAVIRLNRLKGRALPESEPEKKPEEDFYKSPEEDFVTKQELRQRDEKTAVNKACENSEIDENWDEIIVFYTPSKDTSYEAKLAAIMKAHKLWSVDKKADEKPEGQSKIIAKELATEKGLNLGKKKEPKISKKSIIPKQIKMESWYD